MEASRQLNQAHRVQLKSVSQQRLIVRGVGVVNPFTVVSAKALRFDNDADAGEQTVDELDRLEKMFFLKVLKN